MSDETLATEDAKTTLENTVSWYLGDKLNNSAAVIATNKYLTSDNLLVYLTRCNVAELSVPRIKIQVLQRVDGGVHETGYQIYGDHRFEKYQNDMVFGAPPDGSPSESATNAPVTQAEAGQLIELVNGLQTARLML
jgi:hypothetical protein